MRGECFSWKMCFHYNDGSNLAEDIQFLEFTNLAEAKFKTSISYHSIRIITVLPRNIGHHYSLPFLVLLVSQVRSNQPQCRLLSVPIKSETHLHCSLQAKLHQLSVDCFKHHTLK